jgi:hypothetical protein
MLFKLLGLINQLIPLLAIVEELKAVKAANPATVPGDYAEAALEIMATPTYARFEERVGEEEAAKVKPGLPGFLMLLDLIMEKR